MLGVFVVNARDEKFKFVLGLGPNFRASGWRFLVLILEVHGFEVMRKK